MLRSLVAVVVASTLACGRLNFDARTEGDANIPSDAQRGDANTDAYAQVILIDEPIAYWRFEENSGSTAIDAMGNHPGTFSGTVIRDAGVAGGRGAVFDGSSTRLLIGDVFAFPGTAPYSLELWARPILVNSSVRFVIDRTTSAPPDDGYQLYVAQSFTLISRSVVGTEGGYATAPAGPVVDRWTHVVATYDGESNALYMDGVLINSSPAPVLPAARPGAFTIGDLATSQTFKYAGMLDEVAVYGWALPANRVAAHAAAGR